MARFARRLLFLQIVSFVYAASAQTEFDYEDYGKFVTTPEIPGSGSGGSGSGGSGSGAGAGDPTQVDNEYGDYDEELPYVPASVDICQGYPSGMYVYAFAHAQH